MPSQRDHEHYRYLGVPIGMTCDVENLDKLVDDLCEDLDRIHSSLLAPWQSRTQSNACARARMALAVGKLTTGTPKFRGFRFCRHTH